MRKVVKSEYGSATGKLTENLSYSNLLNQVRGSPPCRNKRDGQYNEHTLVNQSIHSVLKRVVVEARRVTMPNGWRQVVWIRLAGKRPPENFNGIAIN